MKQRILLSVIALMLSLSSFAQLQVTRFMKIPIDGFKKEMIQKLESKGFELDDREKNVLKGEFNGSEVNVFVCTNNNKVCRIMLCDVNLMDEGDIKIRFNKLCRQFENNPRYVSYAENSQTIPYDTNIAYEMSVHDKKFEALFYQKIDYSIVDTVAVKKVMHEAWQKKNEEFSEEFKDSLKNTFNDEQLETLEDVAISVALKAAVEQTQLMMPVWFRIEEYCSRYYICMYYDNENNRANGEDL